MTPEQAEKIAVVNEKVELAGHTVTLDALWKSDEGKLILTYHIRNKLSYSRSGWSVDFFSIQNGDDSLPVLSLIHIFRRSLRIRSVRFSRMSTR